MYAVSFIYSNLSPHCFPFSSFQGKFFSIQGHWPFFTVTTVDYCLFHGIYRFSYRPWVWSLVQIAVTIGNSIPSLCIFTIWPVVVWQRSMRRPPRMRTKNGPPFIIDRSSPGGGSRGGVFHRCSDIYTPPPQNLHRPGNSKQILPLTGDAVALARVHMPEGSPMGWRWGLGCCLLNAYSATRWQ